MSHDLDTAMSESRTAFFDLVVPRLQDLFGGGTVYPVEGVNNEFERKLDREAGIDAVIFTAKGVYGIASRIQFGDNYRTFTIRKSRHSGLTTEWEKLQKAANNGSLMPSLTVQAYVDRNDNQLLGAAIASTKSLIQWIEQNPCATRTTGFDQRGQAEFIVVPWDSLRRENPSWFHEFDVAQSV